MFRRAAGTLAFTAWLAISATACGSRIYSYAPVVTTGAEVGGHPAAELPFPPDSPHGNVRLATLGLAEATAEAVRSIHVRMVASNRDDQPWIIDRNEQELAVAVGKGPRSTVVRAMDLPQQSASRIEVPAGHVATLDLYFPLPPGAEDASDVPAFDLLWTVHSGPRAIATRTPFERFLASGPAQNVPAASYPYTPRTEHERRPGTPDTRWPGTEPIPLTDPVPRPLLP